MQIDITKKVTKEEIFNYKGNVKFYDFFMHNRQGVLTAEIVFEVFNPPINFQYLTVEITAEEWKEFWDSFTSGGYLYEVLKEKEAPTLEIPKDIETSFNGVV